MKMHRYYKNTFLTLVGFAIVALALIFFVNDQSPFSVQENRRHLNQGGAGNATTKDIIRQLDEDTTLLDVEYNFKLAPDAQDLDAPSFADELKPE